MKRLIHKYLNEFFRIENNKVRRNQKYNEYSIPSNIIINELNNIFSLEKNELKWYIKSWARKQSKSFSFNIWWTPKLIRNFDLFPIIQQVTARTIGMDLVEVRPMQAPIRGTQYLDAGYVYAPYIPVLQTPQVVEWDHADRLVSRYATREVNPNYYGQMVLASSRRPVVNPETGEINLPYNQLQIEEDFYL